MALEWPLRPKTSHFRSPVCSSHVLTPHDASMNDPEAGLGLHQLGGWHCQCNFGLRMASPPQHGLGVPPACSSHVLTPHNASLDNPEAGLGLHQLGGSFWVPPMEPHRPKGQASLFDLGCTKRKRTEDNGPARELIIPVLCTLRLTPSTVI
jgi:hypothetical protein